MSHIIPLSHILWHTGYDTAGLILKSIFKLSRKWNWNRKVLWRRSSKLWSSNHSYSAIEWRSKTDCYAKYTFVRQKASIIGDDQRLTLQREWELKFQNVFWTIFQLICVGRFGSKSMNHSYEAFYFQKSLVLKNPRDSNETF